MADYGFDDLGLHRIIGVTHRRQQGVAARADEGGARRCRLGPLLRQAVAPLRGRAGPRLTVSGALAQSGLVPLEAQVLLAHVLGKDRAWLVAHGGEPLARERARRVPRAGASAPGRRAGRVSHRNARVLGPAARRLARRADPASRNGNARRARARAIAEGPGSPRAGPRHGIRRDRARASRTSGRGRRSWPRTCRPTRSTWRGTTRDAWACANVEFVRSDWYDGLAPSCRRRVRSHRQQSAVRRRCGPASLAKATSASSLRVR